MNRHIFLVIEHSIVIWYNTSTGLLSRSRISIRAVHQRWCSISMYVTNTITSMLCEFFVRKLVFEANSSRCFHNACRYRGSCFKSISNTGCVLAFEFGKSRGSGTMAWCRWSEVFVSVPTRSWFVERTTTRQYRKILRLFYLVQDCP